MTSPRMLRPRCRPDSQQAVPAVVGVATLASLVLTSLVLSPPAEAGRTAAEVLRAPSGTCSDGGTVDEVTGR